MRHAHVVAAVTALHTLAGCGLVGYDDLVVDDLSSLSVTLVPVYPSHANWNDYVRNSDPLVDTDHQLDIPCNGSEVGRNACLHGGERRKAVISGRPSCDGLSATDELGVFDWVCRFDDGAPTFFAHGFRPGMGLKDLISVDGWKENSIAITDGTTTAVSEPAVWGWSNAIAPLPANPTTAVEVLADAGTIYVAATSMASNGYNIDADRIAVVTLAGATLSYGDSTTGNTDNNTGELDVNHRLILASGQQKFLWIEGNLDANGTVTATGSLLLHRTFSSRVHELHTTGGLAYGVRMAGSSGSTFTRVHLSGSDNEGLNLHTVADSQFIELDVTRNGGHGIFAGFSINTSLFFKVRASGNGLSKGGHGIFLNTSSGNVLYDVNVSNNEYIDTDTLLGSGIQLQGDTTSDNIVSIVTGFNNRNRALMITGSNAFNTVTHVTAANALSSAGLQIDFGDNNALNNLVTVHNAGSGLAVFANASQTIASDIVAAHNLGNGVQLTQANNDIFLGTLIVGPHPDGFRCRLDEPGTMPGLVHDTCTDTGTDGSSSYAGQSSTATFFTEVDLGNSFVGQVTSDDAANPDDSAGAGPFDAITNWVDFDNRFRGWGIRGTNFPVEADTLGHCFPGATCGIWDWRVRRTDTVLRNAHGAFTADAPCPASVHGDEVLTDQLSIPNTFLRAAVEVMLDERGDDDGLCESNEACIYAPNFGAYQGEGDFAAQTCTFVDGAVSGVTMYGYPTNGI